MEIASCRTAPWPKCSLCHRLDQTYCQLSPARRCLLLDDVGSPSRVQLTCGLYVGLWQPLDSGDLLSKRQLLVREVAEQ